MSAESFDVSLAFADSFWNRIEEAEWPTRREPSGADRRGKDDEWKHGSLAAREHEKRKSRERERMLARDETEQGEESREQGGRRDSSRLAARSAGDREPRRDLLRREQQPGKDRDLEAAEGLDLHREHRGEPRRRRPPEGGERPPARESGDRKGAVVRMARAHDRREEEERAHGEIVPGARRPHPRKKVHVVVPELKLQPRLRGGAEPRCAFASRGPGGHSDERDQDNEREGTPPRGGSRAPEQKRGRSRRGVERGQGMDGVREPQHPGASVRTLLENQPEGGEAEGKGGRARIERGVVRVDSRRPVPDDDEEKTGESPAERAPRAPPSE